MLSGSNSSVSGDEKLLTCQRIGCDTKFSESNNFEGDCVYHSGPPLFHDGKKAWSCCKKESHDFSLFLSIPGCSKGKHTDVKPAVKIAPSPNNPTVNPNIESNKVKVQSIQSQVQSNQKPSVESCPRCKQGFLCSDHPQTTKVIPKPEKPVSEPAVVNVNQNQTCKNKGCGKVFTELANHSDACSYHPGPAVFHDRKKGWACCDVHVNEFDEFLEIPPCTKGWHKANPEPKV